MDKYTRYGYLEEGITTLFLRAAKERFHRYLNQIMRGKQLSCFQKDTPVARIKYGK